MHEHLGELVDSRDVNEVQESKVQNDVAMDLIMEEGYQYSQSLLREVQSHVLKKTGAKLHPNQFIVNTQCHLATLSSPPSLANYEAMLAPK